MIPEKVSAESMIKMIGRLWVATRSPRGQELYLEYLSIRTIILNDRGA